MIEVWKRNPLQEDELSDADHSFRVSLFAGFREDICAITKDRSVGHQARAAARHLLPYIANRVDLLEYERRHPGLVARIETPLGAPVQQAALPFGGRRLLNGVRRFIVNDARIAIRWNNYQTRKLLKKIEREAPTIERLLTILGVAQDSELRPATCLPGYVPPADPDAPPEAMPAAGANKPRNPLQGPPLNLSNLPARIKFEGKTYHRNGTADLIVACKATDAQLVSAVLRWAYEMPIAVIGRYLGIDRTSVQDRLNGYTANARKSDLAERARKSQAKRGMDAADEMF
ncbi:MAG: hypothetical protein ACP5E2_15645 [Terracidiphilus sp.]